MLYVIAPLRELTFRLHCEQTRQRCRGTSTKIPAVGTRFDQAGAETLNGAEPSRGRARDLTGFYSTIRSVRTRRESGIDR
jgi:hypothetical protein